MMNLAAPNSFYVFTVLQTFKTKVPFLEPSSLQPLFVAASWQLPYLFVLDVSREPLCLNCVVFVAGRCVKMRKCIFYFSLHVDIELRWRSLALCVGKSTTSGENCTGQICWQAVLRVLLALLYLCSFFFYCSLVEGAISVNAFTGTYRSLTLTAVVYLMWTQCSHGLAQICPFKKRWWKLWANFTL